MTRHGKNCTAASVYSYHERKRDAKTSGYGTLHARLGADSIKEFDCCSLTLQPCKDPVITQQGFIFDREAILEFILAQKKEIAKKTKEWEKQCALDAANTKGSAQVVQERNMAQFNALESTPARRGLTESGSLGVGAGLKRPSSTVVDEPKAKVKAQGNEGELSNMKGQKSTQLPSFWIPDLMPNADASKLEKPSQKVLCPLSGKTLKLKDLMPVKFTDMPDDEHKAVNLHSKKVRYMCPVTHDALTNTVKCAYLKKSKAVVTWDVVDRLIKKDWLDPISGDKVTEDDILELQRGGTGYAATNEVKAKLFRPQLELQ